MNAATTRFRALGEPLAARTEADRRRRRQVVRLIFVTYLVFLLEGMLRKWFLPGLSQALYFIRDPFVLLIYGLAFRHQLVEVRGWFAIWTGVAAVTSVVGIMMLALNGNGPVAGLFGVRSYWLYMPLAFVVAACVEKDDLINFVRINLLLAIPICLLTLAQYRSSPDAFINQGVGSDAPAVTVIENVVRPYGVFTYTGQHVIYVASLLALAALAWVMRSEVRMNLGLLMISSFAILVMTLTTGSRSIYFFALQVTLVLGLLAVAAGRERHRGRALMFLLLAVATSAALFATVLNPALDAMVTRHTGAVAVEGSVFLRALGMLTSFTGRLDEAPALGYGIGAGTSTVSAWTGGISDVGNYENEWERLVQEIGPVFGFSLIVIRAMFVAYLLLRALASAKAGDATGLLLFGFVSSVLLVGQITFSTIIGFLCWLYVGLVLAATGSRHRPEPPSEPRVRPRANARRHHDRPASVRGTGR
jgi:hypothetical protein